MKPLDSRNAKKSVFSVIFQVKDAGIPDHCSFQHPQQLRIQFLDLKHSQPESSEALTCILKKISLKLDFPIKSY
jgi:hypothetical protein